MKLILKKSLSPSLFDCGFVDLPLIEQDWALGHAQPNELLVQHHQSLAENDVCVMQVCPPLYRQKDKNDYRLTGFEVIVHMLVLFFKGIYYFKNLTYSSPKQGMARLELALVNVDR